MKEKERRDERERHRKREKEREGGEIKPNIYIYTCGQYFHLPSARENTKCTFAHSYNITSYSTITH